MRIHIIDRGRASLSVALLCAILAAASCGTDEAGQPLPEGCVQGDFTAYHGLFHAHTSYSDGKGTPRDAYEYARDQGGLDVFGLTDHLEQQYIPIPPDKWGKTHQAADEFYVPGSYVTLVGFEYGTGFSLVPTFSSTGHNNVFFSEGLFPAVQLDYHKFFDSLVQCPTCTAQFNHPWEEDQSNWDDFQYDPDVDERIHEIELSFPPGPSLPFLFQALDKGWHVSPMMNQDNHDPDWGTKDDRRTGLWLADLTRESVHEGLVDRRTFSTQDKNSTIRMTTRQGCWMGSVLHEVSSVELSIEASDPDAGDGFEAVELWGPGEELLRRFDCRGDARCAVETGFLRGEGNYVLAQATQTDGDVMVSAPLWLSP